MAFTPISAASVQAGQPVKNSLMDTIRTNLDDLDSRVSSVGGTIEIFNQIVEPEDFPQGTLIWSLETVSNFQAIHGSDWSLVDSTTANFTDAVGSSISIPDSTDRYLRNKGDGSESLRALLADQVDMAGVTASGTLTAYDAATGAASGPIIQDTVFGDTSTARPVVVTLNDGGATETRPNSVVANLFVKNGQSTAKRLIFRASSAMDIDTAKVTQLSSGPTGTLEVDIKVGATIGAAATIFSTRPSVSNAVGDNATSTNAAFSSTSVAVGDWIIMEIVSLQQATSPFHIQLSSSATT